MKCNIVGVRSAPMHAPFPACIGALRVLVRVTCVRVYEFLHLLPLVNFELFLVSGLCIHFLKPIFAYPKNRDIF